jgi:hypothetical protein
MLKQILLLSTVSSAWCGFEGGPSVVKLTPSVERPVLSVLRAARAMRVAGDTAETWNAFDRVFEPMLEERDKTTDEALAALLSFYIGEHAHEDLTCELVSRGSRELPFLELYRDHQIHIATPADALTPDEKQVHYDSVIARIRAREDCTRER